VAGNIHELIRLAFWAARDKGKPDWWRMTTPVLKNRLLTLTDRQFKEQDYGAHTLLDFVSNFPEMLALDTTTYPAEVELRPAHIRSDLWRAVTDYTSGEQYVWDRNLRRSRRRRTTDDQALVVPSLTKNDELAWKSDFAVRHRGSTSSAELSTLERWANGKCGTNVLSDRLKSLWNRERSWRVWELLTDWFLRTLPEPQIPKFSESPEKAPQNSARSPSQRAEQETSDTAVQTQNDYEINSCRSLGDWLSVGELLCSQLSHSPSDRIEELFAQIIVAWATPVQSFSATTTLDIINHIEEFVPQRLATALVNLKYRFLKLGLEIPTGSADLAFRVGDAIASTYDITSYRGPAQLCVSAAAKLASSYDRLISAVRVFQSTNTITAKAASIELLRASHQHRPLALVSEEGLLREIDLLLGASFRKFCESCEQHEAQDTLRRGEQIRAQLIRLSAVGGDRRSYSRLWNLVVRPSIEHVSALLEEATRQSELFNRPELSLEGGAVKMDLGSCERPTTVSSRLSNSGHGRALRIDIDADSAASLVELQLLEPTRPFDLAGNTSQIVLFSVVLHKPCTSLQIPIVWVASDSAGQRIEYRDTLQLEQQHAQPDWDSMLLSPPYTIKPVKKKEQLFGRDSVLRRLMLHATAGTSTFLWGQKRVGKTSVLQVLASELEMSGKVACLFLRMGEIGALHEGQIAHTIATRLNELCWERISVPAEESFGAGMSRLVPVAEALVRKNDTKLVVIIDEFDDLDPAFYTGERGRLFVKALRSLSEVGITFFFVGSERMDTIYRRHSVELNKWVNVSLDRIESFSHCKELVVEPVRGAVEYEDSALSFIVSYCGGNPFYMHLFCFEAFTRCVEDHRTFVSSADVQVVRQHLLRTLGRSNFAHFWEDNPELSEEAGAHQKAENSLVLACVASLGGRYDAVDDVYEAQESLGLTPSEMMTKDSLVSTLDRLRQRRVMSLNAVDNRVEVSLPIFREWLSENVDELVPTWRESVRNAQGATSEHQKSVSVQPSTTSHFPISEDDLLAVSQRLIYCGKQKDVAEVRQWLRQFDDDSRIEVAFLLLNRLAESGYMNEGARGQTLSVIEETLQHRRVKTGEKAWKIVRGRKDNLCISYVDSETKSGATTARELAKRLRPGKVADGSGIGPWLKSHAEEDPLLLIVDDFAGTGGTLDTGLNHFFTQLPLQARDRFLGEGRVLCYCQYAFPEALDRLRANYAKVEFFAAHVFGDDVRALDPLANLFETNEDRTYARDILLQLGRELTPQNPLGWGEMGALVAFHNTTPNNTLPIFWSYGKVNDVQWKPLFPRA
jgi:hypothetical protein